MTAVNSSKNIFKIFSDSLVLYIKNIFPLTSHIFWSVTGQFIGIILMFYPAYLYKINYLQKLLPNESQSSIYNALAGLLLIMLPGLFIFTKSFWDYMLRMISLNSMIFDINHNDTLYDDSHYLHKIQSQSSEYIRLLTLISLIWLGITILTSLCIFIPNKSLFALILLINSFLLAFIQIKLSLVFQVFSFEDLSSVKTIKRSWYLTKKQFWKIAILGFIVLIITGSIVPYIISTVLSKTFIMPFLVAPVKTYIDSFILSQTLTEIKINSFSMSYYIVMSAIQIYITSLMLPLGSACFTSLYQDIKTKKETMFSVKSNFSK